MMIRTLMSRQSARPRRRLNAKPRNLRRSKKGCRWSKRNKNVWSLRHSNRQSARLKSRLNLRHSNRPKGKRKSRQSAKSRRKLIVRNVFA